ncbi:hypothetical protein [Saccharomonospora azurea]|uniref:hypothetical protein n=1 Tax=Saccharomonospora azurea TaxID=40988 RepID=UPI003D8EF944
MLTRGVTAFVAGCAVLAGCGTTTGTPVAATPPAEQPAAPSPPASPPGSAGSESPAATLPVPIEFSLPEGWQSVPPADVGVPEAAFVALHPASRGDGSVPTIVITGDVRDSTVDLEDIAAESVKQLETPGTEVRVESSKESGTAAIPALTQAVRISPGPRGHELLQLQTFLGMSDTTDPRRRAVLEFALTTQPEHFQELAVDFQEFVSTVRVESG